MSKKSSKARARVGKEEVLRLLRELPEDDRKWLLPKLVQEGVTPFCLLGELPKALNTLSVFFYGLGRASEVGGKRKPDLETLQRRSDVWQRRKKGQTLGRIAADLELDTDTVKKDLKRAQENIKDGWLVLQDDNKLVLGDPVDGLAPLLEKMQSLIDRVIRRK
jgi:hypothetical protein